MVYLICELKPGTELAGLGSFWVNSLGLSTEYEHSLLFLSAVEGKLT